MSDTGHWRLEWRDSGDVVCFDDMALCQTFVLAQDLIISAHQLALRDRVAGSEFYVCCLDASGVAALRVLTDGRAIAAWNPDIKPLPQSRANSAQWAADIAATDAATAAIEEIRKQMQTAWKCGRVSVADAMRMVSEAALILDPADERDASK